MKKKEYLPFHAKVLFDISKKINKEIYWTFSEQDKINEIAHDSYSYSQFRSKLESESAILKALEAGAKASKYGFYEFKDPYLEEVLLNGTDEQIEFFVKQNNSLIGEYSLSDINAIIPKLKEETISTILMSGSSTFGIFNNQYFENTIVLVKNHSKAIDILCSYLEKRLNSISHEYAWIGIRSKIIENFGNELEKFSNIPVIKEYLNSLADKPNPFIETDISNTIYLRINCEILKSAYPLSFGTFNFYTGSLKKLIKAFEKNSNENGVVKVHINDSMPKDTGYQYTHIYINLNNKSKLTENNIKEIIAEYYGEYLTTFDSATFHTIDNLTETWVRTKLLYNDLNKEIVGSKSSDKKTVKI